MSKLLIKNIKELVQVESTPKENVTGAEMKALPTIKDAWLAVEDGIIVDFGEMDEWGGITDWSDLEVIDASGQMVFPSFCDSHTHIVYAASREEEFVDRINGLTYEEIAKKGGGILNSAKKLQNTSEEDLFNDAWKRLEEIKKTGTGAVEIKSGYGLSVEGELKILRVIKKLKEKWRGALGVEEEYIEGNSLQEQTQSKHNRYAPLVTIAQKQTIDGKRISEPEFIAAAMSTAGEMGWETIRLQEILTASYARMLGTQPKRDDGIGIKKLTANYRNKLRNRVAIAVARGQARMCFSAGLRASSCRKNRG